MAQARLASGSYRGGGQSQTRSSGSGLAATGRLGLVSPAPTTAPWTRSGARAGHAGGSRTARSGRGGGTDFCLNYFHATLIGPMLKLKISYSRRDTVHQCIPIPPHMPASFGKVSQETEHGAGESGR